MLFDWTQCLYELSIRDEDCNVIRDFIQKFHDVSAYVPSSGELEKKLNNDARLYTKVLLLKLDS